MTKKLLLTGLAIFSISFGVQAQSTEELAATKAAKEKELSTLEAQLAELTGKVGALKGEVTDLTDKLTPYPRWDVGALGSAGLNFSGFNNWFSKGTPNTEAVNIGLVTNAYANLQQKKYFWRNGANLTLAWLKFDDLDKDDDNEDFQTAADAFNFTSLFGYKLSEKWAISTLGEYRTSVLDGKFNNPGYFDIGVGATWTPITDLVVVLHPLNYNFVFSNEDKVSYESSLGCKIMADYKRQLIKGIAWKTNFSAFLSYKETEYSNWTWINGLTTAVRGVGISLDFGLRNNKQESYAGYTSGLPDGETPDPIFDFGNNKLQTYYLLGFSYALATKK
ncbi:MAG: DUF3078 domain-containing protein [Saprospiraceae bacterium]|jgi:uncharacterized coiled-coil protein SlyX|nr:DUF3078 domain-containing protein [Saprospiraceae bacterium]